MMSPKVRFVKQSSSTATNAKQRRVGHSPTMVRRRLEQYEDLMASIANGHYGNIIYNNGTEIKARWTTNGLVVYDEHGSFNMLLDFSVLKEEMIKIEEEYHAFITELDDSLAKQKRALFDYDLTYFRQGVKFLIMWKLVRNIKPTITQLRFLKTCPTAIDLVSTEVKAIICKKYENCNVTQVVSFTNDEIKGKQYKIIRETIGISLMPMYIHKGGEVSIYRRKPVTGRLQPLSLNDEIQPVKAASEEKTVDEEKVDVPLQSKTKKPKKSQVKRVMIKDPEVSIITPTSESESHAQICDTNSIVTTSKTTTSMSIDVLYSQSRQEDALRREQERVEKEKLLIEREREAALIEEFQRNTPFEQHPSTSHKHTEVPSSVQTSTDDSSGGMSDADLD